MPRRGRSVPEPQGPVAPAPDSAPQMSLFVASARGDVAAPDAPAMDVAVRAELWQVHDAYLFAETRGGLAIVDQHSAHERVLYEEALRWLEHGSPNAQRLLFPIPLRVSPEEAARAAELEGLLAHLGFELEPGEDGTLSVIAAPQPHAHFDPERCLSAMLAELTGGSELVDPARSQHQRVALSFACKASYRVGQRLSSAEMSELFDRLFATEQPFLDIHGRPTVVQLSLADLRARFRP